jgi:hypothetical protein
VYVRFVRSEEERPKMLKVLYSVAIALLVVFFVGFGISAFSQPPSLPPNCAMSIGEDPVPFCMPPNCVMTNVGETMEVSCNPPEKTQQMLSEADQREEAITEQLSDYNRLVSSIAIGVAVALLVGSILWLGSLEVIGDGVALGAVLTLFYALIRAGMTGSEVFRFVAVAIALVVVIALVYVRFVRSEEERPKMLKVLYSVAIALLVVVFVGSGISAFYPDPEYPELPWELDLASNQENPTPQQRELLREYKYDQKMEVMDQRDSDYNLVVSVITIGIAVLLLVGSILWLSGLAVIGDGVTLGAVFTLVTGLEKAFGSNSEVYTFVAVGIALVALLALVYVRFVRPTSRGTGSTGGTESLSTEDNQG